MKTHFKFYLKLITTERVLLWKHSYLKSKKIQLSPRTSILEEAGSGTGNNIHLFRVGKEHERWAHSHFPKYRKQHPILHSAHTSKGTHPFPENIFSGNTSWFSSSKLCWLALSHFEKQPSTGSESCNNGEQVGLNRAREKQAWRWNLSGFRHAVGIPFWALLVSDNTPQQCLSQAICTDLKLNVLQPICICLHRWHTLLLYNLVYWIRCNS